MGGVRAREYMTGDMKTRPRRVTCWYCEQYLRAFHASITTIWRGAVAAIISSTPVTSAVTVPVVAFTLSRGLPTSGRYVERLTKR